MTKEMNKITSIKLLYDNNEEITIPIENVSVLHMRGFNKISGLVKPDQMYCMKTVDTFTLKIGKSINSSGTGFSYDEMLSPDELEVPLVERIKNRLDLVAVELNDGSDENELIYFAHDDEFEHYNTNLNSEVTGDGGVLITLKPNK